MNNFVPNYYSQFTCIADKCRHNCCIGWEIDIDSETLKKYQSLGGNIGKRMKNAVSLDETPHFVLSSDERCPFLNNRGLCDIISECGEEYLCEICTMHPRFVNTYSSFCETGLGLCCEEAARIILCSDEKFSLVCDGEFTESTTDIEDAEFVKERSGIFEILQDRRKSVSSRIGELCKKYALSADLFRTDRLCDIYLSLERLDENWTYLLQELSLSAIGAECFDIPEISIAAEQLLCYFVFRHAHESLYDGDMASKICFAAAGTFIICALCALHIRKHGGILLCDMAEYARMFSSEVEYSEENTQTLFDVL